MGGGPFHGKNEGLLKPCGDPHPCAIRSLFAGSRRSFRWAELFRQMVPSLDRFGGMREDIHAKIGFR